MSVQTHPIEWPFPDTSGGIRTAESAAEFATKFEPPVNGHAVIEAPLQKDGTPYAAPTADQPFFLTWTINRALMEVPVVVVGERQDVVLLWECQAIGEPMETQRRNFVRVAVDFNVELALFANSPACTAVAIDLSEGGLRCSVDRWALDPGLRRFSLELPLPEGPLVVDAQVVWWGNLDADGQRTVGLRFVDLDHAEANSIRRQVFAIQIERRRYQ